VISDVRMEDTAPTKPRPIPARPRAGRKRCSRASSAGVDGRYRAARSRVAALVVSGWDQPPARDGGLCTGKSRPEWSAPRTLRLCRGRPWSRKCRIV